MRRIVGAALLGSLATWGFAAVAASPEVPGASVVPVPYEQLAGWAADDHAAPFRTFRRSCIDIAQGTAAAQSAVPASEPLVGICLDALAEPETLEPALARRFFERHFQPFEVTVSNGRGFLTGYYEPEFAGSVLPTAEFKIPLLARPDDLVSLEPGDTVPGVPPGLTAARKIPTGFEPYPERAAIEDGAVDGHTASIVYLREPTDAFVIHVQGSARIRLPDGRSVRVAYAGRNGQPYTSVARLVMERLGVRPADMTADVLTDWLKSNPTEARELLRRNRSYIFFRLAEELDPDDGPIGAAGISVSPGRSVAIDRTVWSYGLPIWLEGELPEPGGGRTMLRRLVVAQDTGSAIVGPARADLFVGSGEEAGARAGLIREPVRFVVLWPKQDGPASGTP
ncbi:MAG: lytic murein transglycosylase [Enterovirga sp.]|jgi:membrane-bound lytic murein transglycosylase A|nr:lytic murein transglycosylase [Enterovirga sp.]